MNTKIKQIEDAALWIERSHKDYRAARILEAEDIALSIYLLAQCVEKSIKAIAVASGKFSPSYIKKRFGHNSKKLLIKLWKKLGINKNSSTLSSIFNLASANLTDRDLFKALQYTIELQRLPLFSYPFGFEQNDTLALKVRINDEEFQYLYEYNESPPSLILVEPPSLASESKSLIDLALQFSLDSGMKALIARNISGKGKIEAELENQFSRDKLLFSLFLLAALTYEHEAWSRYPDPGKDIGCQDYTGKLPIVKHIGLVYKILDVILPAVDNLLSQIVSE